MKRLILTAAIILGGLTAATAQTDEKSKTLNTQSQTRVESNLATQKIKAQAPKTVQDYKEVKNSEVPQTVKDAVAKDFDGATISKAYVNGKGDYKIEFATVDAKRATVYMNKNGELVKMN